MIYNRPRMTTATTDYSRELAAASQIARGAGRILMDLYKTDLPVQYKGPNDPVLEADRRANAWILKALSEAFPRDALVSEEEEARGDALQSRVWYIDPMDGTKEFILKNGEFSVMIGLAVEGRPRLGAVYQPAADRLLAGAEGLGAWQQFEGVRSPLKVSSRSAAGEILLASSRSHRTLELEQMGRLIGSAGEIICGSVGLKIGLIARREADVYLEPAGGTRSWDSCAPEAILSAAGGVMTDFQGKPLVYDGKNLRNAKGIVAANGACHKRVLDAVSALGPR